ncbi:MAG: winged helix-turn-helix transcriptional regulator [Acidobacteria bacterium]|nr:winged helix-turn-helix transcriptional regulator [Acidobacteriota bacterium]
MLEVMAVTKALADQNRVRVLLALTKKELCVCQIVELLDLAPSTVSKHMAILKQARLVQSRKEGRWIYYRLPQHASPHGGAIAWICGCLGADDEINSDRNRLKEITCMEPEDLCQLQKKKGLISKGKTHESRRSA